MCDYSLHAIASRPPKLGDRLVTTDFPNTLTRRFSAAGEPDVAVCLMPGTELAFEAEVERHSVWKPCSFAKTNGRFPIGSGDSDRSISTILLPITMRSSSPMVELCW